MSSCQTEENIDLPTGAHSIELPVMESNIELPVVASDKLPIVVSYTEPPIMVSNNEEETLSLAIFNENVKAMVDLVSPPICLSSIAAKLFLFCSVTLYTTPVLSDKQQPNVKYLTAIIVFDI